MAATPNACRSWGAKSFCLHCSNWPCCFRSPREHWLATLAAVFRLLAIASGPVGLLLWSPRTLGAIGLFSSLSYLCQLAADLRRPL